MARTIEELLSRFQEEDATVRMLWAVFGVLPGGPQLSFYGSLDEARMLVAPELDDAGYERAKAFAASPEVERALRIAEAIDTGDVGITVLTGVRSALTWFFGDKARALETDPQQGADAALKAGAIALLAHTLFPGTPAEKIRALRACPTGEALLTWFAAAEVALPFADDLAMGAGSLLGKLMDRYAAPNLARLEAAAGPGTVQAASGVLGGLTAPLEQTITAVGQHTGKIADAARQWLPPAVATAGTVAGAVATAADALPVYTLLGARLAAEASLRAGANP